MWAIICVAFKYCQFYENQKWIEQLRWVEKLHKARRFCTRFCVGSAVASQRARQPASQSRSQNPLTCSHTDHCSKHSRQPQQQWQRKARPHIDIFNLLLNESFVQWQAAHNSNQLARAAINCIPGARKSELCNFLNSTCLDRNHRGFVLSLHMITVFPQIINNSQWCALLHAEVEVAAEFCL